VLGKTDPNHADKYKQQSIIIVASNTPGIEIKRMLSVYGYDDAPHGHAHLVFKDVRVPAENIVLGEGRGFEVMQVFHVRSASETNTDFVSPQLQAR
jgi:acyl-CoA dehydrogenase